MPRRPPTHKPARMPKRDTRPSSAARGYGAHWRKLRAVILAKHPLCQECGREESKDVDHVVPLARGGTHDESNLKAYCHSCHSRKTATRDGGFGRPRG